MPVTRPPLRRKDHSAFAARESAARASLEALVFGIQTPLFEVLVHGVINRIFPHLKIVLLEFRPVLQSGVESVPKVSFVFDEVSTIRRYDDLLPNLTMTVVHGQLTAICENCFNKSDTRYSEQHIDVYGVQ